MRVSLKRIAELGQQPAIKQFLDFLTEGVRSDLILAVTYLKFGPSKAEDRRRFTFSTVEDYRKDPTTIIAIAQTNVSMGWNAYVMPTFFRVKPDSGKRGDLSLVAGGQVVWTDIDLPEAEWNKKDEYVAKYKALPKPPSAIISSGRGFHLFWKLDHFIEDHLELKYRNKWLRTKLEGDDCFDATHIMRLPGTKNYKKVFKEPADVKLCFLSNRKYSLGDFEIETDGEEAAAETSLVIQEENLPDDFLEKLTQDMRDRIVNGPAGGADRSNNDWYVASKLLELGYTPGQVYTVFCNQDWEVGSKGRANNGYIVRTIQQAFRNNKKVVVEKPDSILQPVIEKHLLHRDKNGKVHLDIPAQSLPVVKEACEVLIANNFRFLYDKTDNTSFIVTNEGAVIRIGHSREFSTLLCNLTQFTPDSRAFKMFAQGFAAYANNISLQGEIHPWSYLDYKSNTWHLLLDHTNSRDLCVYTPGAGVNVVKNGDSGVILTASVRSHGRNIAWTDLNEWRPVLKELIDLTHDSFPCSEIDRLFLTCYMFAIPIAAGLIHNGTLPLLHLTGGSGQGKTGTLKTISAFIHGTPALESGTTGAGVHIIAERDIFIPFDDYENLPDHLQNFILTNASGAVRHKVKDVESDTLAAQQAHTMLAMTSISDLTVTTLRRRAVQINVSSTIFGSPDYDETHKDRIITNRGLFWNAYIQFITNSVLTYLNAGVLAQKSRAVASTISVQEFKPLCTFVALVYEIGKALAHFDPRFACFVDTDIIPRLIETMGANSSIAFENNNPVIEPLVQLSIPNQKYRSSQVDTRVKSPTGLPVIKALGDGVYIEAPDLFVATPDLWFTAQDCLVLAGFSSSFGVKLSNSGHRALFHNGTAVGSVFTKHIKEAIGSNNLNNILEHNRGDLAFSRLIQLGSSSVYAQYVHGNDGNKRGAAWRFWFPSVDKEVEHVKKAVTLKKVVAQEADVSAAALVKMVEGLIKNAPTQEAKQKLLRMLVQAKELH